MRAQSKLVDSYQRVTTKHNRQPMHAYACLHVTKVWPHANCSEQIDHRFCKWIDSIATDGRVLQANRQAQVG